MVTSIRLLGGSIGLAVPLLGAIAFYWAGGSRPGLLGLLFTIALLGVPLGPVVGAVFAKRAIRMTRPILVAAEATLFVVLVEFAAYAITLAGIAIMAGTPVNQAVGAAGSALETVLASVIFGGAIMLGAWAYGTPFALLSIMLLRRLGKRGISASQFASAAVLLVIAAFITGFDALRRLGA